MRIAPLVAGIGALALLAGGVRAAEPSEAAAKAHWVCRATAATKTAAVEVQLMLDAKGEPLAIASSLTLKGASELPMVSLYYPVRGPDNLAVTAPRFVSVGAYAPTPKRKGAERADIVVTIEGQPFRRPWGLYSSQSRKGPPNSVGIVGVVPLDDAGLLAAVAKGGPLKVEVIAGDGGVMLSGEFNAPAPEKLQMMADGALAEAKRSAATPDKSCDRMAPSRS